MHNSDKIVNCLYPYPYLVDPLGLWPLICTGNFLREAVKQPLTNIKQSSYLHTVQNDLFRPTMLDSNKQSNKYEMNTEVNE